MDPQGQGSAHAPARIPALLLGAAMAAAAVLIYRMQSGIGFFVDEWDFLLYRGGLGVDVLLDPHNEHIAVLPIAIYKALQSVFGMDSSRPYQLVLIALLLTVAALLFAWLRRRVGAWPALAGAVVILFLGSAGVDLLWAFQITLVGATALGLGALLALDRGDDRHDRIACALLVGSTCFNTLGLAFAAGAAVSILGGPRGRHRAYVFAIPLALYALWFAGWGHRGADGLSFENLAAAPGYMFDGLATSLASLLGLAGQLSDTTSDPLALGRPLLVVALALAGLRLWRLGRIPRELLVVVVIALVYWAMAAVNGEREPTTDRLHYAGAVMIVLIVAELARGLGPPGRVGVAAVLAVTALAVAGNIAALDSLRREFLDFSEDWRADLGALEIAGNAADPNALVIPQVRAGPYLAAAEAYGSDAHTPAELASADEDARQRADKQFASLLGVAAEPIDLPASARGCHLIRLSADTQAPEAVGPAIELRAGRATEAVLALRRYSSAGSFPVVVGTISDDDAVRLEIPEDNSNVPWQLGLSGTGSVRVCPASS